MTELIYGAGNLLIYFGVAVVTVLAIRAFTNIYDELFRKLLHFVLLGSLGVWTVSFPTWWLQVVTAVGFVVLVYPILIFFERFPAYSHTVTERKKGELKHSLILVFLMFALVVTVAEGLFRDRLLALASVYAWGVGDAFAALAGKRFGAHKLTGPHLSGKKSLEGTLAMFLSSFLAVLAVLLVRGGTSLPGTLLTALVTAGTAALCELYTEGGMDTVTCPLASLAVLIGMLSLFGGL